MQRSNKCFTCSKNFSVLRVPLILPCKHSLCSICIHNEYENQKYNKCPQCLKVSKYKPLSLQRNESVINEILDIESEQERIKKDLLDLRKMQNNFKKIVKQIKEKQNKIQQEIALYIRETMYERSNKLLEEINELLQKIGTDMLSLEKQLVQVKNNQDGIEGEDVEFVDFQIYQNLENRGNSEIQSLEDQKKNIMNQLKSNVEKIDNPTFFNFNRARTPFSTMNTSRFSEISEKTPKYSFCLNLQKIINQEDEQTPIKKKIKAEIQYVSSFKKGEKVKLEYFLQSQQLISGERNIIKPESNATQLEQIGNTYLILSGGIILTKKRFTIYFEETGQVKEYQMSDQRRFHRTVWDQDSKVYILSGNDNKRCEIFDFQNNQFTSIADGPRIVSIFGAFCYSNQIYTTGGVFRQKSSSGLSKEIYIYDATSNEWRIDSTQLPIESSTTSVYLQTPKTSLIYYNYSKLKETQFFDFKSIYSHGNQFQTQDSVYSQPIIASQKVFQFNYHSDLLNYELKKAEWMKVEISQSY